MMPMRKKSQAWGKEDATDGFHVIFWLGFMDIGDPHT